MISQITAQTPQIVAKIIAITLTMVGRGSNLKLDMLEAVNTIATNGKVYRWDEYVTDMIKNICDKMPRDGRNYQVPIPYLMDSNVLFVPCQGQTISRTDKISYVEIQTVLPEWNNEGTCKWESTVGKLAPAVKSQHNQMEGASEHPTKSS